MRRVPSGDVATLRLSVRMVSMAIATVALSLPIGRRAIPTEGHDRFLTRTRVVFAVSVGLCTVDIFFSMFRGGCEKNKRGRTGGYPDDLLGHRCEKESGALDGQGDEFIRFLPGC